MYIKYPTIICAVIIAATALIASLVEFLKPEVKSM